MLTNHTGRVGEGHLVDTLLASGVDLRLIFAPEHGFRGTADAGEQVASGVDPQSGVAVVSLYGSSKKPKKESLAKIDLLIFDLQDVGLRYYTYLSTLHYAMEACAESGVPMLLLDRPNPNGFYVDGPILDPKHRSFVGMHPIPIVHGMTLGELSGMINDKGWLKGGVVCDVEVITCENYTHQTRYTLPVAPSPNLPNQRSIYLYASTCFFEGTPISLGRGTDAPFQCYGHPRLAGDYTFTPRSTAGAKSPPLLGKECYGVDLRTVPTQEVLWEEGINLDYLIDAYQQWGSAEGFFTSFFEKLTGVDYVRQLIVAGATAEEIEERWSDDVARFKLERKPYLLYEE